MRVGLRPPGPILCQALLNNSVQSGRDIVSHGADSRRHFLQYACDQSYGLFLPERFASGQQVIKGGAGRVDIGPEIERLGAKLLWRGKRQRTDDGACTCEASLVIRQRRDREAEVA